MDIKNLKVKELIEVLKKFDPEAIACWGEMIFESDIECGTFEQIQQIENKVYIDDDGEDRIGKVVVFI